MGLRFFNKNKTKDMKLSSGNHENEPKGRKSPRLWLMCEGLAEVN
jgi:hypothetical protein